MYTKKIIANAESPYFFCLQFHALIFVPPQMVLQRLPTKQGEPPPRPEHYDHRYELPAHALYPLAKINWHPLDSRLVFYEEPHVYTLDGVPLSISMTSVAHSCQEEFDADRAIELMKMSRSQSWPRLKYTTDIKLIDSYSDVVASRGVCIVKGDVTVASSKAFDFGSMTGRSVVDAIRQMRSAKRTHDDLTTGVDQEKIYTFEREMTEDEIKESWRLNGEDARNRGTEAHLHMQLAVESVPFRADDVEVSHGLKFFERISSSWRAYRAEWEIVFPEADLAGSIDLVIATGGESLDDDDPPPMKLAIIDYKRTKDLKSKMRGGRRQQAPMAHLDDCDGATYALQLSGYQYILEKVYGFEVVDRVLMSIHPDTPFCTSVPYLETEIEYLMAERIALTEARASCDLRCPISNVCLHDPVIVADGEERITVDRKCALLKNWTILEDDTETKKRVGEHVTKVKREVPIPTFSATWKAQMPVSGEILPFIFQAD